MTNVRAESQYKFYDVGLQLLEGGSREEIANRLRLSEEEVDAAWECCRSLLSAALSDDANEPERLLTLEEIKVQESEARKLLKQLNILIMFCHVTGPVY